MLNFVIRLYHVQEASPKLAPQVQEEAQPKKQGELIKAAVHPVEVVMNSVAFRNTVLQRLLPVV